MALYEVALCSAIGMACVGFFTFVAGILHLLYPWSYAIAIAIVAVLAFGLDSPMTMAFWRARLSIILAAVSIPSLLLYAVMLFLAVPAFIPDLGSDATTYHVAYAYEWAQQHHIFADRWLRLPYYANNWLLVDAAIIELFDLKSVQFLTWLTSCLTAFAIYASIVRVAFSMGLERSKLWGPIAFLSALAFAASPTTLHWLDTGLVDVPIGFFFLMAAASLAFALLERSRHLFSAALILASFFVGMKISLIAFLPMFAAAIAFTALRLNVTKRQITVFLTLFFVLSAPWYVKNFIEAGDPIAPTLNLAFHGVDSKYDRNDMKIQLDDLKSRNSPLDLLELPITIFADTSSRDFREPGTTAVLSLVFLPSVCLLLGIISLRDRRTDHLVIFCGLLSFAIAYWNITSHLARYSLLFLPALAAFVGSLCLMSCAKKRSWVGLTAVIIAAVAAFPSPAAAQWYTVEWKNEYQYIWAWYKGDDDYLKPRSLGYLEMKYLGDAFHAAGHTSAHVYGVELELTHLYSRTHGIVEIGDWFGPERFYDLATAIRNSHVNSYVNRFDIGAFAVPSVDMFAASSYGLTLDDLDKLDGILQQKLHFQRIAFPASRVTIYLRPDIAARSPRPDAWLQSN